MPRQQRVSDAEPLSRRAREPMIGTAPSMRSALQAIVTWATSTTNREQLMEAIGFPLAGDMPAFLLVNQLVYRGASRPTDMADAIQTGRSNVSKIVRRLEDAGLVVRAPDPADDRAVVIALTDVGREMGRRILDEIDRQHSPVLSSFADADLAEFERLLVAFARGLDALPGHPLSRDAGVPFPPAGADG